ncbi:MFS transporter [Caulobacter sp. SLTY]|uniref:TCR/Tet family MFS transporter n=1 Tax=Caulobacter sp. SLTY TaxID=2683262 RepID=UPI00141305FE|nr:TCR/Tet family MFS transporter [Caulobacter sp. SLTY]NBB16910.1 MFS transporter [Caulobacter sp. SLTY]
MTEQDSLTGHRRTAAVGFIFVTALIDVTALGIMIPVLPLLVKQLVGGDTAQASEINVLFATTFGLMQFFCAPIIGLLSDRFGRRPVLLASNFGIGVDFLFMAFAPGIRWLYVGRVINGATAASFSTANAYIADITGPENRAKAFGMMGAAFGLGFTFGPTLGGFLADIDLRLPFLVCAALALLNWLYGFYILPESLPPERRVKIIDWRRANPLGSLRLLRSHPDLLGLASVGFLFQLAHVALPVIFVLYLNERYGWDARTVGLSMMATGISNIIVQAVLIGPVVKKIGERGALLLGLFSGAVGFAIYGLAPTGWLYLAGVPIFALMGFTGPGLQGLMTRRVGPSEQGQLQGANGAIMGIAGIIGPALFGLSYAWALRHKEVLGLPGLPILIASALMVAGFVLALNVAKTPAPAPEPLQS